MKKKSNTGFFWNRQQKINTVSNMGEQPKRERTLLDVREFE